MKQLLPIGAMTVVAFTSCLSPSLDTEESSKLITFQTSGYSIETRATLAEAQITDLWVFDYVDGVLVQQVHQTSDASAFGSPTLTMTHGAHTLKFVASRGAYPIIDDDVLTWSKPLDTFGTEISLTIDNETAEMQTVVLSRIVAKLTVCIKDKMPENAAKIFITLSNRSMGLFILNMTSTLGEEVEQSFEIPSSIIGKADSNYSLYSLALSAETPTTNVRITLTDAAGEIITEGYVASVPLTQNRATILRGYIKDFDLQSSVSLNTDWSEEQEQTF